MLTIPEIYQKARTIAVVGLSSDLKRASNEVAAYLQRKGYRIIPVNPSESEVLGERAYPDLLSVPEKVDVVDIFRRAEQVGPVVDQAITMGAAVVWMQEGITNAEAAERAMNAGLTVVMDRCMMKEHRKLTRAAAS